MSIIDQSGFCISSYLTVLTMITLRSWPWNSSVVPPVMSVMPRSSSRYLSFCTCLLYGVITPMSSSSIPWSINCFMYSNTWKISSGLKKLGLPSSLMS